jgi:shikimate dehydrogenase
MPARYAVMGNPIAHSLSPTIHRLFAEQTGCVLTYEKMKIDLPDFEAQVNRFFQRGGKGLNITQPFKQRAFLMSQDKTARCLMAGAANTLWFNDAGRLQTDNTDGVGLLRDLTRYIEIAGKRVLVLGAGGAARGILGPLLDSGPQSVCIANRTVEKARVLCQSFPFSRLREKVPEGRMRAPSSGTTASETPSSVASRHLLPQAGEGIHGLLTPCSITDPNEPFDLILNTTSAHLENESLNLPSTLILPTTVCYDLNYQQKGDTPFVLWARSQGCTGLDGLGMLVEQAAEAFFIWHGIMPDLCTRKFFKLTKIRSG